ncbi:ribonuclease H-like domain-containing protein [Tanacetum coccineum]
MVEPEKLINKKELSRLDKEIASKLQAEFDEEVRLAKEKVKKEEEANIVSWDNVQAMIDADYQMAQQMQVEEQEKLSIEENSKLFVQLLEARKKHFAAMRAQEKRNKPPTKAQKRNTMSTYLKNMAGYKQNQLKNKSFNDIQKLFDKAMKRVNTFIDMETELVEGSEVRAKADIAQESSSKRACTEMEQESIKKQKVDEDKETVGFQRLIKVIPDKKEVAIDAIPLATKPPSIGRFGNPIEIGKAKHGLTRPDEGYERVLLRAQVKLSSDHCLEAGLGVIGLLGVDFMDFNSEDLISSLDLSNPLHLENSDFSSNTIISVKLTGTKNYRVWVASMKLAINTKNKTGFIDGLLDVKDAFAIVSREESHRGIASSSTGSLFKPQVSGFVSKSNNWTNMGNKKVGHTIVMCFNLIGYPPSYNENHGPMQSGFKSFNANSASTSNENDTSLFFTNEQMMKLMNLINKVPSGNMQANMASRLGHPSDQDVDVLQHDLNFTKDSQVSPCHICSYYHAPSSVLNGKSLFELVPNDDGRGYATSNDDGNDHPCTKSSNNFDDSKDNFATSIGEIERYKARLVAKGFSQRERYDYLETFSHVVKMSTMRCMLNVAMCNNWDLFQLDIINAFLYGDFSEDVYMTLPHGFDNEKSKDLGKLKYLLGIEVLDNKDGICLSQRKYCLKILHEYGMLAAKHIDTSLPENTTLNHVESDVNHLLSNVGNYQRLVGKLIYRTNIRPDISYDVHCLSQFMHAPLEFHLDSALRVLRYLKGSPDRDVLLLENLSSVEAEYRSMAYVTCEVIWLSNLLSDMGVIGLLPIVMYCDNNYALQIAANPGLKLALDDS